MGTVVDLTEIIDDELEGFWFHYIRSEDFGWAETIPDIHHLEVNDDDIIIHKQILEGDRFPTIRYHIILGDEAFLVDGKEVREKLAEKVVEYIRKHKKLPFACTFEKVFKNGAVKIDYKPTRWDNFTLKIPREELPLDLMEFEDDEKGPTPEEIEAFFSGLETEEVNPLSLGEEERTIEPIKSHPVMEKIAAESGNDTVCVFGAKITKIDKRYDVFQGHRKEYYLLQMEGGKGAPGKKKGLHKRDLGTINVKCSKNAYEKYELDVGQVVSFCGKYKVDKKDGVLLQRVVKFVKGEELT